VHVLVGCCGSGQRYWSKVKVKVNGQSLVMVKAYVCVCVCGQLRLARTAVRGLPPELGRLTALQQVGGRGGGGSEGRRMRMRVRDRLVSRAPCADATRNQSQARSLPRNPNQTRAPCGVGKRLSPQATRLGLSQQAGGQNRRQPDEAAARRRT
jgi:hypothetical protein